MFYLGGMVSYVAVPFQILRLTGSNFAVGAIALVELVPLVVFGLYGGALADHVDRTDVRARVDREWWGAVCGRSGRDGRTAARLLALRLAHRRARHP